MKLLNIFLLILIIQLNSFGQVYTTSVVPLSGTTIPVYEKFELGIILSSSSFSNVYDPNIIDIQVQFKHVSSSITTERSAFYYLDFERCSTCFDPTTPSSICDNRLVVPDPSYLTSKHTDYNWRVRFTPDKAGNWQYRCAVKTPGHITYSGWQNFTVTESANKGFVLVSDSKKGFKFDNVYYGKEIFFPIGLNVVIGPADNMTYNRILFEKHKEAIDRISDNKGNLMRIWMDPSRFGVEWNESGIGDYTARQNRAYDLDQILEYAHERDFYIQLCLDAHIEFQNNSLFTLWLTNPYKTLMVGSEDQDDFFTKPLVKEKYKQRLRYIISRWGYSTNIFAFEMFNEVDLYAVSDFGTAAGYWGIGMQLNVTNWHNEMISYGKTLDPNHLFTTSTASPCVGDVGSSSAEKLFLSPFLDFIQEHAYSNDFNTEYQRSFLSKRALTLYPNKPVMIGEFGTDNQYGCWLGSSNFTASTYTSGDFFHDENETHNSLWSTAFSGNGGAGLSWSSDHMFNKCWGGQDQYFKPLASFINSEKDFFLKDFVPIANPCSQLPGDNGKYDNVSGGDPAYLKTPNLCYPTWATCDFQVDERFIPKGIETSNDSKLEVFALKNEDSKVIGWVHFKDNYWYNLPHNSGPLTTSGCVDFNDNQPSVGPSAVGDLIGETITIKNLPCDGEYKIEFFTTYPKYDITGDGILDDEGIISPLTITSTYSYCGSLTFTVPDLKPITLTSSPFAPDYAFKISKLNDHWSNFTFTDDIAFKVKAGAQIVGDNATLLYPGTDGRLNHFWYTETDPQHEWLTDWSNDWQNVDGAISYVDPDVFYRGKDSRLHHYWYGDLGGVIGWHHEWLTDWTSFGQHVGGDLSYSNGNVFFKGVDDRLHHYWFGNLGGIIGWHHEWLTDWSGTSQNVGGSICSSGETDVFYRGVDDKLHHYWYGNIGGVVKWYHLWHTDWTSTSENIDGDVFVPKNNSGQVFFRGTDGKLHEYYYEASTWTHKIIKNQFGTDVYVDGQISANEVGNHVYFKDDEGYMTQLYQTDAYHHWSQDRILCTDDLKSPYKMDKYSVAVTGISTSDRVYYPNENNDIHYYGFNQGCTLGRPLFARRAGSNSLSETYSKANSNKIDQFVFPNPFKESIHINNSNDLYDECKIIGLMGQIMISTKVEDIDNYQINTADLLPGTYIAVLFKNGSVISKQKIVKN